MSKRINPYWINRFVSCVDECERSDLIKAEIVHIIKSRGARPCSPQGLLNQIKYQLPDTPKDLIIEALKELGETDYE